eukprot:NODE_2034_length_846_cov_222.677541_g1428_i0.p2 GENE.NODE_2034_length_846_cov_222.677541_g1428_i0~~NODE_2034_length_846_cov_222.677541_g1428_i0.p2  ORF type:complete len:104 (+),score=22.04 NODE_2034_length_846_cov_222.677541_g1428_i0:73-384(+)
MSTNKFSNDFSTGYDPITGAAHAPHGGRGRASGHQQTEDAPQHYQAEPAHESYHQVAGPDGKPVTQSDVDGMDLQALRKCLLSVGQETSGSLPVLRNRLRNCL